jgi:hypothetical protein
MATLSDRQYLHIFGRGTRGTTSLQILLSHADNLQTTAHTFSFAFALLALHPDKQEEMYQHIKRVLPDGRIPVRTTELQTGIQPGSQYF